MSQMDRKINNEVVYATTFYAMCMTELHHRQQVHQTLQITTLSMRFRESDVRKEINDMRKHFMIFFTLMLCK